MPLYAVKRDGFYPSFKPYVEVGGVGHPQLSSEAEKRKAVEDALEFVRSEANRLGCFADLTNEQTLLDAIDMDRLYSF